MLGIFLDVYISSRCSLSVLDTFEVYEDCSSIINFLAFVLYTFLLISFNSLDYLFWFKFIEISCYYSISLIGSGYPCSWSWFLDMNFGSSTDYIFAFLNLLVKDNMSWKNFDLESNIDYVGSLSGIRFLAVSLGDSTMTLGDSG